MKTQSVVLAIEEHGRGVVHLLYDVPGRHQDRVEIAMDLLDFAQRGIHARQGVAHTPVRICATSPMTSCRSAATCCSVRTSTSWRAAATWPVRSFLVASTSPKSAARVAWRGTVLLPAV